MEHWQSALIEAAQSISLEARCYGDGLPGSSISIAVPKVSMDNSPEGVEYDRMEICVYRGTNGLSFEVYQNCFGIHMHPHVNRSAMCLGDNRYPLQEELFLTQIDTCTPESFVPILIKILAAINTYSPRGAYHDGTRVWTGCRCLTEQFPEFAPEGMNLDNAPVCSSCIRSCALCGTKLHVHSGVFIGSNTSPMFVCTDCAQQDFSLCDNCGRRVSRKIYCPVTGIEVCKNCGILYQEVYYHLSACISNGYEYVPAHLYTNCNACRRAVPCHESIDPLSVHCDNTSECYYYRNLIMQHGDTYAAICEQ